MIAEPSLNASASSRPRALRLVRVAPPQGVAEAPPVHPPAAAVSPLTARLRHVCAGRSYRQLGALTGTSCESARRYLAGHRPTAEFVAALCERLDLSADWLLLGRGDPRAHRLTDPDAMLARVLAGLERQATVIRRRLSRGDSAATPRSEHSEV